MEMTLEERNKLIEDNMAFIGDIARTKCGLAKYNQYEYNDLLSAGVRGFIVAINKYDPKHGSGANILTYAKSRIIREMNNEVRKRSKTQQNTFSMHSTINHKGETISVSEIMTKETHEDDFGKAMDMKYLHEVLNSDLLTETEKVAIRMRFFEGAKLHEIDKVLQENFNTPEGGRVAFYFINTATKKLKKALRKSFER